MEIKAAGSVDDYDAGKKSLIANKAAAEAGVASRDVAVSVRAASLLITISITAENLEEANRVTTALGSKLSSPEATSEALGIENVQEAPNVMQTVRAAEGAVFTTLNMVLMVICATSIVINLVYTQRLYKHVLHGKAFALAYDLQEAMKERKEEWLLRKASRDLGIPLDGEPWVLVEVLEVPVEPGTAPPTSREKNGSTNAAALAAFAARSPYQETPSVPQSPLVTSRSSPALAKESSTPRSPTPRRGLQPSTLAALAVQSKRDYMPWSPSPAPGSRPTTARSRGRQSAVSSPIPENSMSVGEAARYPSVASPRTQVAPEPLPPIIKERPPADSDLGKAFEQLESRPLSPKPKKPLPDRVSPGSVTRPDAFQQFASSATRMVVGRLSRAGSARRSRPSSASPAGRAQVAFDAEAEDEEDAQLDATSESQPSSSPNEARPQYRSPPPPIEGPPQPSSPPRQVVASPSSAAAPPTPEQHQCCSPQPSQSQSGAAASVPSPRSLLMRPNSAGSRYIVKDRGDERRDAW